MKKQFFRIALLSLIFAMVMPNFAAAQNTEFKLIPYRKADLWGYSDVAKKIVIAPEYLEVNFFIGNYAIVRKTVDIEGKPTPAYGVIDAKNKVIVPMKYYDIRFQKDIKGKQVFECIHLLLTKNPDYYDADGKLLAAAPSLEQALAKQKETKSSVEPVQNGEKFGLINGKDTIASAKYDLMNPTSNGYFLSAYDGKFGIIDVKGQVVVPFEYKRANPLGTGFATVKDKTLKEGYISPTYKFTLDCKYFKIMKEYGKFVEVKLETNKKHCIIGSDGTEYCED